MTYFEDNANFYPAIYATGDFDIPQGWSPVAVSRAASTQMFNTMPNRWNPIAQPVPMVSPWTNPFAQNNYGKHHDPQSRRLVFNVQRLTRGH